MLDYDFERLAEEHIQVWKDRYFGKSRQEIIIDLNCNYDWQIELENEEVPDEDIEEFQYEFTKEVLHQLGLNISDHAEKLLSELIEETTGEIKSKLILLRQDLTYWKEQTYVINTTKWINHITAD